MKTKKLPTKEAKDAAYRDMQDKGMFQASRLDIGRDYNRSSFIRLKDAKGRARIAISVAANGDAKLNFLDENGKVVYSLPDESKVNK